MLVGIVHMHVGQVTLPQSQALISGKSKSYYRFYHNLKAGGGGAGKDIQTGTTDVCRRRKIRWCGWEAGSMLPVAQRWGTFIRHRGSFTVPSVEHRDWEVWGCSLALTHERAHMHTRLQRRASIATTQKHPPHLLLSLPPSLFLHSYFLFAHLKRMELS